MSDHSPPLEGWQAKPDGVVASYLYKYSVGPFPSCGGELAVRYFFNSPKVLHDVTPIDLLAQSAVLSDGVVVACLYKYSVGPFPSCGGVAGEA